MNDLQCIQGTEGGNSKFISLMMSALSSARRGNFKIGYSSREPSSGWKRRIRRLHEPGGEEKADLKSLLRGLNKP